MASTRMVLLLIIVLVSGGCVMLPTSGAQYEASKVAGLKIPITQIKNGDRVAIGTEKGANGQTFAKLGLEVQHGLISGLVERGVQVSELLSLPAEAEGPRLKDLVFNSLPLTSMPPGDSDESADRFDKLILYRIINTEEEGDGRHFAVSVFLRIIDMKDGTVLWAGVLHGFSANYPKERVMQYYDSSVLHTYQVIYESVRNSFPPETASRIKRAYLTYNNPPHHELYSDSARDFARTVEDAFTAALSVMSFKSVSGKIAPVYVKRRWQYDGQIFYVSPVLADSWKWLHQKQGVESMIVYRILTDNPLSLSNTFFGSNQGGSNYGGHFSISYRVIDARDDGAVSASGIIGVGRERTASKSKAEEGFDKGERIAAEMLLACGTRMKGDKSIMLVREDYLPVTNRYSDLFDEDYSMEDGMYSSFAKSGIKIAEKLGGLYLRGEKDYDSSYFILDPLLLGNWAELQGQKTDALLLYRMIRTGLQGPDVRSSLASLRVGYRLVDVGAGKVIYSGLTD